MNRFDWQGMGFFFNACIPGDDDDFDGFQRTTGLKIWVSF